MLKDRGRGISFTKEKSIAERFSSRETETGIPRKTPVGEFYLKPNAKILDASTRPRGLQNEQELLDYAKNNGYDAIDISKIRDKALSQAGWLTENEIRILNKDILLTKSQLTDIWNKAQKTPVIERATVAKEPMIKTSGVAKSIQAKAIEEGMIKQGYQELADYDASTIKQQSELGSQYNIREITRMVTGESPLPVGMKAGTPMSIALDYAIKNKDVKLMRALVRSPLSTQISSYGSGLSLSKMIKKDTPLSAMEDITNARKRAAEKRTGKKESAIEKEKKAEVESKKKTIEREKPSKYDWNKLINEIACK